MNARKFHEIWVEQCNATHEIKLRYGVKAASDYLVTEKLLNFFDAAISRPEFAEELPRFVAYVRGLFTPQEMRTHLARIEREQTEYAAENDDEEDDQFDDDEELIRESPAAAVERAQQFAIVGEISAERRSDTTVELHYLGLDGVERITCLEFEPAPTRLDTATALFELSLAPGEGVREAVRISCDGRGQEKVGVGRQFYSSLRSSRRALKASSGRATSLDSSNSLFNEFARRSVADLDMLLTQTEHGPYPFAGIPWFLGCERTNARASGRG